MSIFIMDKIIGSLSKLLFKENNGHDYKINFFHLGIRAIQTVTFQTFTRFWKPLIKDCIYLCILSSYLPIRT